MIHEFSRTELLIGEDGLRSLRESTILVFGVGGVGSHCIEALARSGVGHLVLVDPDQVALTNINRQSIAYHSTLGRYKTHVMRERILDINPQAVVETREMFVLPDNLEELFSGVSGMPDYIIDAIDTVSAKLALAGYAYDHQIPLLASMGASCVPIAPCSALRPACCTGSADPRRWYTGLRARLPPPPHLPPRKSYIILPVRRSFISIMPPAGRFSTVLPTQQTDLRS